MNFRFADAAIRDMNRRNLRSFGKLKQLKFDELNVLEDVKAVYDGSAKLARRRYRDIGIDAFAAALRELSYSAEYADALAQESVTNDWVLDMLEDYDPVTLYRFVTEAERKRQRLIEAILATNKKNAEIDRALKLWTRQIAHYAERSVIDGTVDGYKAAGVKRVMWVAVGDEKTCQECQHLDKQVFDIDKIPNRPHYHCRCLLLPV